MKEHYNNILVPVDFEDLSLVALEQSYNMARLLKLEITLLYVIEDSGLSGLFFPKDKNEDVVRKVKEKLEELARKSSIRSGVKVKTMVVRGKVHAQIREIAEQISAKFIVMGTKGSVEDENGKVIRSLGANTSRVIRSAKRPVITINSKHNHRGVRSILLPLDLTRETRQKVTLAIEMAKIMRAKIKVISALWSKGDRVIMNQLLVQLKQVKKFIEKAGINCTAEIIDSSPEAKSLVPIVLKYAKEQGDVDLIIIMTQHEKSISDFFVSPSAHDLIRLSEIPVLSVIPMELEYISIM